MSRSKKDKRKKGKKGNPPQPVQRHVAPEKAIKIKTPVAPSEPVVEMSVVFELAELQATFDKAIESGNIALNNGEIENATKQEQIARDAWKASKKLNGVESIKPGDVRKLKQAIIDYGIKAKSEREQKILALESTADKLLDEVRFQAGYKMIGQYEFCSGDLAEALNMIESADPDTIEARADKFLALKTSLMTVMDKQVESAARGAQSNILRLKETDTAQALRLLNLIDSCTRSRLNIDDLRKQIEEARPRAEAHQKRERQKREEARARREKQDHEQKARDFYLSLVGDGRRNRIKYGQILRKLKEAQKADPVWLAEAIRIVRGSRSTFETEIERFRQWHQDARLAWEGHQDLDWVAESKGAQQLISRLLEAHTRGSIAMIWEKRFETILRITTPHREEIFKKILELLNSKCLKCIEQARWLDELICAYDYIPKDEALGEINLYESYIMARQGAVEECTWKMHRAKRSPAYSKKENASSK